jgi:hypothetical protein
MPTGAAIHEIVTPLSTGYTCPVTIRDSSEARNTAMLAMSSGSISPTRCAAASFVTRGLPASAGHTERVAHTGIELFHPAPERFFRESQAETAIGRGDEGN